MVLALLLLLLTGCSETSHYYAPVTSLPTIEQIPIKGRHRVIRGETLYEIAWRYGLDYRYLIKRNRLRSADSIHVGQIIYLRGKQPIIHTKLNNMLHFNQMSVIKKTAQLTRLVSTKPITANKFYFSPKKWQWPVENHLIHDFSSADKGINIPGIKGQPIYAAAAGKVVYAGNGLRGYGNLIIIKHNGQYLSAYAHHDMMSVKEGEWVMQGQKIAEMGNTGSTKTMLHFEVRLAGKPVNPLTLLPK